MKTVLQSYRVKIFINNTNECRRYRKHISYMLSKTYFENSRMKREAENINHIPEVHHGITKHCQPRQIEWPHITIEELVIKIFVLRTTIG